VALVRDEMANMVWGIEKQISLPSGASKPGQEAAREYFRHLERIIGPPPAPPAPAAAIRYQLMNTVPENCELWAMKTNNYHIQWAGEFAIAAELSRRHRIPFIPVHIRQARVRHNCSAPPYLVSLDLQPRSRRFGRAPLTEAWIA
jgi:hypothetical protein